MDELTILMAFALACYGGWRFKRCKAAASAANNLSPETKAKAKAVGAKLLGRWLGM